MRLVLAVSSGQLTPNRSLDHPSIIKQQTIQFFLKCLPPPPPSPPIIVTSLASALSLTLLLNPPFSFALDSPACVHHDTVFAPPPPPPNAGTSEGIVEEAWSIINDSFLPTPTWSPQSWIRKKEDILSRSITTRSKAHNMIKKMLAGLGDPYTRFLSSEECFFFGM